MLSKYVTNVPFFKISRPRKFVMFSIPHIIGEMQLQMQPYNTFMKAKIEN